MTLVICDGQSMVADGWSSAEGLVAEVVRPKILRAPRGDLVGVSGNCPDVGILLDWVERGMDFTEFPTLRHDPTSDDSLSWMWLRTSGSIWHARGDRHVYQVRPPYCIGSLTAATFAEGAMAAGATAVNAMHLTIQHCMYIGGRIQVERL